MRRLLTAAVVLALACAPVRLPAETPAPYTIQAILSLTGASGFLGQSEERSLRIEIAAINKAGGLHGQPLALNVMDDQSNPQLAVQLTNSVIASKTAVLLGPGFTPTCLAVAPLVNVGGPASWCFSSAVYPQPNGYMFSAGPGSTDGMIVLIRYFRLRGWTKIALLTATDATGQATDRGAAAALALPENKSVQIVAHEHYNATDVSLSAQMSRIRSAQPQAVIAWGVGGEFGLLTLGLRDAGIDLPVATCTCAMVYTLLDQYKGKLPKELYFPGFSAMAPDSVAAGPIHDAQAFYFKAFKDAGVRPDLASNLPWDATNIFVTALRKLGPDATAAQVREFVTQLHSWVGINGVYDFRDGSQRGIGQNAYVIDRWDPAISDFVAASHTGGKPR
jgi:branched-chain amino acid transport system substrate-binding protein